MALRRISNLKSILNETRRKIYTSNLIRQADVQQKTPKSASIEISKENTKDDKLTSVKPIKNEAFVKTIFSGKYEKDYLKYPEYTSKELTDLETLIKPIENYYLESARSFDKIENYNENLQKLQEFKLFSLTAPKEFGGQESDSIKFARILESMATKPGLCLQLIIHNELILKSLYMYGTQEQKSTYLEALSNGTLKGAFCFSEPHTGVDAAKLKLISKIDEKSNKVYLNGKKSWVTITGDLDKNENILLVVISKVLKERLVSQADEDNFDICAFLVDKSKILDGELKFNKQLELVNGVNLYEIEFNNVCIDLDKSQLGSTLDIGYQLTTNLYENSRHLVGAVCLGILKDLYQTTLKHSINNIQFEQSICDFQMIKERLCKIESRIYAMESMVYLTAGILDSYELADVAVEGALTKIFCTEALNSSINDCKQILAMSAFKKLTDTQVNCLKTADYLMLFLNTNDVLRHYVAYHGASVAAITNAEKLRKLKDLYNNPGFGLKTYFENIKRKKLIENKDAKFFYLWENVHPSLKECATSLEICTVRLLKSIEFAFIERGSEIVDYQLNMKRLADMTLEIYLMNCCIARASRSYSIGLYNADFEFYLTSVNVHFAKKRFDLSYNEIMNSSEGESVDNLILNIADRALKEKKHSSVHSLSRTFN